MARKKGTTTGKINVDGRINETIELLISNPSGKPWQILANRWGISKRSADRLIAAARGRLRKKQEDALTDRLEYHRREREKLYSEARAEPGKEYLALEILRDMAKLDGAYAPEKRDLTTKGKEIQPAVVYVVDDGRGPLE